MVNLNKVRTALSKKGLDPPLRESEYNWLEENELLDELEKSDFRASVANFILEEVHKHRGWVEEALKDRDAKVSVRSPAPRSARGGEVDHLWAIAVLLAEEAGRREDVHLVRQEALDNKLLSYKGVEPWIKAQAAEEMDLPRDGYLDYPPAEGQRVQYVLVGVGGVLDRLCGLARRLASEYDWDDYQAVGFVLTGGVPAPTTGARVEEQRLSGKHPALNRVVLSIDPTCKPEEVWEVYRQWRNRYFGGRRNRIPTEKLLRLVTFCSQRPGQTLREWFDGWNALHPQWAFTRPGNLRASYEDTRKRLLDPPFDIGAVFGAEKGEEDHA